jgi:sugar lactone lactonase YvrE
MARAVRVVTDEIWFGEVPRWRAGRLWFGDWTELAVRSVTPDGALRTEVAVGDCRPSGMGWAPNGVLVGDEGKSLFMLTSPWTGPGEAPQKGRILMAEVDVAHAGCP